MAHGIAVNIGLNGVDPSSYQGWSGTLAGCVNDAKAMASLAAANGITDRTMLLNEKASAHGVTKAISDAARSLSTGDFLFITYSGHGGQVPDESSDEPDRMDETWVLHDRQLIDDELYALWSGFKPGVRIFVLSDSCHSGSVLRLIPDFIGASSLRERLDVDTAEDPASWARAIPPEVADRQYRDNRDLYREIQTRDSAGDRASIKASVILISGCQDNQTSADGRVNGLFTQTLLEVWDGGHFTGDYESLHKSIVARMPMTQSPNLQIEGVRDLAFLSQRPLTV